MNKYLASTVQLTVLSAALLAAGCGGGGSSASAVPVAAAPVAQRSVGGVASKGTIKKARVQAFALDAQGVRNAAPIASTVTAEDGSYTIQIPTTVLTFVIEVDAAAGATMADEASGQDLPFPADMKLRNVVRLADSAETAVTSHVSPLTELIVKTAEGASGGLTGANIAQAKTGIAAALGFDPEKVKPVNSDSAAAAGASQEERMQSLTLAAISKMAQDGKLGCSAADASARISCVVKEVAKSGTISGDKLTLGESVRAEVRAALTTVAGSAAINHTGVASVAGLASFAQSVVPTTAGAPTGIEATKKMFATLRTNVNAWASSANPGGSLTTQVTAVKADFDKAISPLDQDLVSWMGISVAGIEQFADFKSGVTTSPTRTLANYFDYSASCTVYSDDAATVVATSAAGARTVACGFSRYGASSASAGANLWTYSRVGNDIVLTPVAGQDNAYAYKARSSVTVVTQSSVTRITTSAPSTTVGSYGSAAQDRATGTIAFTKSGARVSSLTIAGMMPARVDDSGIAVTDYSLWNINASRTLVEGSLFNYALAGDLASYKGGVMAAKLTLQAGSFVRVQETTSGAVTLDGVRELQLNVAGESGASKISGAVSLANFVADKSAASYVPTKLVFTGSVSNSGAQFFSGTLALEAAGVAQYNIGQPMSATNFVKLTASLTGTLTVPARPPLTLTASVANDSFDGRRETLQYNDGSVVINASRVVDGANAAVVSISSAEGVSLKLVAGEHLAVMKDDAKVAELNTATGVITYVDGSFESLK